MVFLFIYLVLGGGVKISFLKRSQQFIFPFVGYNGEMIVGKRTSFRTEGQQGELFLQLGERIRAVFLESVLISESQIDLKYYAVWESGPYSS